MMDMWAYWISGMVLILIAVMLASHVTVHVSWKRKEDDDRFSLLLKALFGIVRIRREIPLVRFRSVTEGVEVRQETETGPGSNEQKEKKTGRNVGPGHLNAWMKQSREMVKHAVGLKRWMKQTLSHVKCIRFQWHSRIGFGDAADTATGTGILWAVKTMLTGLLTQMIRFHTSPDLAVYPAYNRKHFSSEGSCIVKIRLGYAIIAALFLMVRVMKAKGGIKTWKSILFRA